MHYNRYIYRLPVQAVPITDIVKNSISAADTIADPIIGTSLVYIVSKTTASLFQVQIFIVKV